MNTRGTLLALTVLLIVQTFADAQPLIQSINPSQGPIAGGTQVTLTGTGFTGTTLTIDGTAITPSSASDTQIVFQTPVHDNGIVTLKLSGNGPTAYAEFLYLPPRLQDLPPGYITTVAGIGPFTGLYRPATQAELRPQGSPAFDRQGNMYIPEPSNNRVIRVRPDGILEPFAGSGVPAYQSVSGSGDGGPATEASLTFPRGVTTDANGNVYITDYFSRIRRVDAHGIITTIAGDGTRGYSGDGGPAAQAKLTDTSHITGDGNGTIFFIDFDTVSSVARIRKITPDGIISTVAGIGPPGFSGDGGPAMQAQFDLLFDDNGSLALDPQGNLFIVDRGNQRIRRVDGRTGIITTVFGPAYVTSVASDSAGNIYFDNNLRIKKMSPSGEILATYGNGQMGSYGEDGAQATDSVVNGQPGAVDALGNIIFLENMQRVRRINVATGKLETVAGMTSRAIGESGPALATTLQSANAGDLAFLPSGELLVADSGHHMVRTIDANGTISTFGQGGYPNFPEGKGWDSVTNPVAVKTAPSGQVYIADTRKVYRIDTTGQVHMIAGTGIADQYGYSGDGGPATEALLCQPWDIAFDGAGNLFIADTNNNRIRRVDARTGIITTVAGSGPVNGLEHYGADGQGSFSGDGGPATQATLNTPYGVAVDALGNLFIEDSDNQRIRKVATNGIITTFAANNASGSKLAFDVAGNLYGVFNASFVRFDSTGKNTPVAGQWPPGFSGDGGPALQARTRTVAQAVGIAIDAEGNFFFIDNGNFRVRAVRYGAVMAAPGSAVTASGGSVQMAPTGTTFPTALQINLKSPEGNPANGIRVDFAAPATGASCTFAGGSSTFSILTGNDGHAGATCTANSQAGFYSVTATPLALGQSVSFSLTNKLSGADCVFNWAENTFPQFFSPARTASATATPYYFRYYTGTANYLATSSADSNIWVLGHDTGNALVDAGPLSTFMTTARCSQ